MLIFSQVLTCKLDLQITTSVLTDKQHSLRVLLGIDLQQFWDSGSQLQSPGSVCIEQSVFKVFESVQSSPLGHRSDQDTNHSLGRGSLGHIHSYQPAYTPHHFTDYSSPSWNRCIQM